MIIKFVRRYSRTLRSYRCIAQKDHGNCWMCQRRIRPGDEYDAFVSVSDLGFCISKWHVWCPDDFWEEEEENARRADEYARAQEAVNELAAAA